MAEEFGLPHPSFLNVECIEKLTHVVSLSFQRMLADGDDYIPGASNNEVDVEIWARAEKNLCQNSGVSNCSFGKLLYAGLMQQSVQYDAFLVPNQSDSASMRMFWERTTGKSH